MPGCCLMTILEIIFGERINIYISGIEMNDRGKITIDYDYDY